MKRLLPIFVFHLFNLTIFSQFNYTLDSIILKNVPIAKITTSEKDDYWILTKESNPRILRIDEYGVVSDMTGTFSVALADSVTTIASAGYNKLLIGTNSDFVYLYNNGTITHFDSSHGFKSSDNHVNAIVYCGKSIAANFPDNFVEKYLVSTNGSAYQSTDLQNFIEKSDFQNEYYLTKFTDYVITKKTGTGTQVTYYNPATIYGLGSIDYSEYGKVLCAYIGFMDNGYPLYRLLGTEHGVISEGWSRGLKSLKVYDIEINGSLLATDKGLYWEDNEINLGLPEYEAFDFANNKGELLVATSIGVLKLTKTTCDNYKASIKKYKDYLCLAKNEDVTLFPQCNNGTDKWLWHFGDGSESSLYNPSHKYSAPGNYEISLISSNGYCKDSATTKIVVYKDTFNLNFRFEQYTKKPFFQKTDDGEINIVDYNNDGNPDIFIPATGLFENVDGSELQLSPTGINYSYRNSIWADLDNDGLNDLIYPGLIYKNLGGLNFQLFRLNYSDDHIGLLDVNNDGLLDIIFGGSHAPVIYKNLGNMKFVVDSSVVFPNFNYINQFKWFDMNGDRKNDLLILTNPYSSGICCTHDLNKVFINENGKLIQKDFAPLTTVQGMNCLIADINNDKQLDIMMQYSFQQSTLFLNEGKGFKTDNSTLLQCSTYGIFSDLDNNGWQDYINKELFSNYGDLIFVNKHNATLASLIDWVPEANASADLDRDGKPELILGSGDGYNTHVYNNSYLLKNKTPNDNNWMKVNCWGTKSNYNAIGTTVYVNTKLNGKNKWQSRLIEAENNLSSQNGYEQIFGTEKSTSIDTLQVNWPSGLTTTLTNLAADKTYQIIEPAIRFKGDTISCDNELLEFTMPNIKGIRYHWFCNETNLGIDSCYFRARKSGVYKCYIESPYFGYYSANLNVTVNKAPVSTIWFKDNKSVVCADDSIIIESTPVPNMLYSWMNKGVMVDKQNGPITTIKKDGTWNQIIVDEKNCRDTSNTLIPVFNPLPDPTLPESIKVCRGDSNLISIPDDYVNYVWSTGDTTNFTYAKEAGTITLKVQDSNNCKNTKQLTVQVLELPYIDLGPDTTLDYGLIVYHPMRFCDFLVNYKWSDGLTTCDRDFITNQLGFGKHVFSASVTGKNGCVNSDTVTITVLPKGWNEENKLIIFPNPASDQCIIYLTSMLNKKVTYEIINNSGLMIKSETYYPTIDNPVIYANLSNISSGFYIIRITDSKTTRKLPLLIQHN